MRSSCAVRSLRSTGLTGKKPPIFLTTRTFTTPVGARSPAVRSTRSATTVRRGHGHSASERQPIRTVRRCRLRRTCRMWIFSQNNNTQIKNTRSSKKKTKKPRFNCLPHSHSLSLSLSPYGAVLRDLAQSSGGKNVKQNSAADTYVAHGV